MKVAVYDKTETNAILSKSWRRGSSFFRRTGRFDKVVAATSWGHMIKTLLDLDREIEEVQFWGHGSPGCAYINRHPISLVSLRDRNDVDLWSKLGRRMPGKGLFWFRTCATFCGHPGRRFVDRVAELLDCRVAAHTFNIGPWHSGLHTYKIGEAPRWPAREGVGKGTTVSPVTALWSRPWSTKTVMCARMTIPNGW